jgi:hypothetical protein
VAFPVASTHGPAVHRLQHKGVHQVPNRRRVSPEPDPDGPGRARLSLLLRQGPARDCKETGHRLFPLRSQGQEHHGHQTLKPKPRNLWYFLVVARGWSSLCLLSILTKYLFVIDIVK